MGMDGWGGGGGFGLKFVFVYGRAKIRGSKPLENKFLSSCCQSDVFKNRSQQVNALTDSL